MKKIELEQTELPLEDKRVPKAVDQPGDLIAADPSLKKQLLPTEAVAYIMTQSDQKEAFNRLKRNRQLVSVTQTVKKLEESGTNVD